MNRSGKVEKLVAVIRDLPVANQPQSERPAFKPEDLPPDWLWERLLVSFATLGGSRGAIGLIQNPRNKSRVAFDFLAKMARPARDQHIEQVLRDAKVRYPASKGKNLAWNVDRLTELGGPIEASRQALTLNGRLAKQGFVQQFKGIGPKYGRNIWLDIGHPDFYETIAIDSRIKAISEAMGTSFTNYEDHENFYLEIAQKLGTTGYQLDRCLYANHKEIIQRLHRNNSSLLPTAFGGG